MRHRLRVTHRLGARVGRLHRCYEAAARRPVSETDTVSRGKRVSPDEHVVGTVGGDRRMQATGGEVDAAEAGTGQHVRGCGATLAADVRAREEDRRDGQRSDAPERRHEQAEEQGSPDGLLVGRTGDEHDAAGDQSPAWQRRELGEPSSTPSEDREESHASEASGDERLADGVDRRVRRRERRRQEEGSDCEGDPDAEPQCRRDAHAALVPTGKMYSVVSYRPSTPTNESARRS